MEARVAALRIVQRRQAVSAGPRLWPRHTGDGNRALFFQLLDGRLHPVAKVFHASELNLGRNVQLRDRVVRVSDEPHIVDKSGDRRRNLKRVLDTHLLGEVDREAGKAVRHLLGRIRRHLLHKDHHEVSVLQEELPAVPRMLGLDVLVGGIAHQLELVDDAVQGTGHLGLAFRVGEFLDRLQEMRVVGAEVPSQLHIVLALRGARRTRDQHAFLGGIEKAGNPEVDDRLDQNDFEFVELLFANLAQLWYTSAVVIMPRSQRLLVARSSPTFSVWDEVWVQGINIACFQHRPFLRRSRPEPLHRRLAATSAKHTARPPCTSPNWASYSSIFCRAYRSVDVMTSRA